MKTITRIDRILIIAPSWLGDATMSHSLIKNLSERFKPVTIDVFAAAALRAVLTVYLRTRPPGGGGGRVSRE